MLKDLTREDWLGMLGIDPEEVPVLAILRGTRNLRSHYKAYAALFDDVHEIGSPNALFEDVLIGSRGHSKFGYASVYGPAMASEIAHLFAVLGSRLLIQVGVCGGLADGIDAGDIVIADRAGCGDGASALYLPGVENVSASPGSLSQLVASIEDRHPCFVGPIWTTSALLAESDADINRWHDAGFIAVDMETATTFAVAQHYGLQAVSILSVFDNPRHGSHLGMTEHDKADARARGEAIALEAVLALADSHV